jgi:transaldolase
MLKQAAKLSKIADNVVIKLPLTMEGLKACRTLTDEGIQTNVTLCFSLSQALLAAKAGATYVSPFVGRHDDVSQDGMGLIEDIVTMYRNYDDLNTQVLVASVRHPIHVMQAALMGADVATIPPKIIHQLVKNPLTDLGLEAFTKDWEKTGQKI